MSPRPFTFATLAVVALATALLACAEESAHTAGDTLAPAAVPADSSAGADRTPADSGAAPDTARSSGDTARKRASTGRAPTRADVDRLYAQARALGKPEGCQEDAECRTAPAGARGCGGPSEFIVYCPRSTDVARLTAVLLELERTEREYNRVNQIGSTCDMRMAPPVEAIGGRCRAVTAGP